MSDDHDLLGDLPKPTSRRRFLLLGGTAVVAAGAATWCARRHHGPLGSGKQAAGGELVFALAGGGSPRINLDPHNSGFAPDNRIIHSIYDSLTELKPDGSVGPWLAENWDISPDHTRYTFHLKRGVTFHDGTVFDAAAVKANFDRLANKANALLAISSLGTYQSARVIDPQTVEITLSAPFSALLRNLSSSKLAIVSPAAFAKWGKAFGQNPVGTGPFRFLGLTPATEVRLERNPDYHWAPPSAANQGPALLEKLTFRNVPEESTRISVLRSGQALAADLIPPQNIASFRNDPDFHLLQHELLETNYSLAFNGNKAPWNDDDVRRAVRGAIDVDDIIRTVYLGEFPRAWSSLSPSLPGSAEKALTGSWRFDPDHARVVLDQKGWKPGADGIRTKDGRPLTISFLDTQGNREKRIDVVQLVRRQLRSVGVDLRIDSEAAGAYVAKLKSGDYDLTGGASFHPDPDILRPTWVPEFRSPLAGAHVDDPQIAQWLRDASQDPDEHSRAELYGKVQHRIADKAYSIPIYVLIYNVVTARSVLGVTFDAHGFAGFQSAWIAQ
jgi:peptide/nickel transport system substrate-binding protein